jgi:hypothetical protein
MKSMKRHDAKIHRAWNAAASTHAAAPRVALEDGVVLKDRSGKDIEAFLADLEKRRGIADRQVRRAELALRIMHGMFLPGLVSSHGRTLSQKNKLVKMFEFFRNSDSKRPQTSDIRLKLKIKKKCLTEKGLRTLQGLIPYPE